MFVCVPTCGTVLLSVAPSLDGMANAVRDLMVIFRSPQLDDLGSEDSRAFTEKVLLHLSLKAREYLIFHVLLRLTHSLAHGPFKVYSFGQGRKTHLMHDHYPVDRFQALKSHAHVLLYKLDCMQTVRADICGPS